MISMRLEKCRHLAIAAAAMAACLNLFRAVAAPVPIQVSSNGHYFVNARGEPFYFLADTQWELFRRYSLNDAKLILENCKAKGFTVVMVMQSNRSRCTFAPCSVNAIEIVGGLNPGGRVILSDMSQWDANDRLKLK